MRRVMRRVYASCLCVVLCVALYVALCVASCVAINVALGRWSVTRRTRGKAQRWWVRVTGCIKSIVHKFSYEVCDKVIGFRIIALGIDTEDEILIPLPVLLYIGSWKNPIQVKRASA